MRTLLFLFASLSVLSDDAVLSTELVGTSDLLISRSCSIQGQELVLLQKSTYRRLYHSGRVDMSVDTKELATIDACD